MGYRPHHILDFQVKIGREVGYGFENTLTFKEVSEALDEAEIHYFTQDDEHIINYESLLDFNKNVPIKPKIYKSSEICKKSPLLAITQKKKDSIGFGGFNTRMKGKYINKEIPFFTFVLLEHLR